MKRGIKTLTVITSLLMSASALTSCGDDYKYPKAKWKEDTIAAFVDGKTYQYEDIYDLMQTKKDSARALYSTAKNILGQLATPRTDAIRSWADDQMKTQEQSWKDSASANNTSYKEEQEKTFESEGVTDEEGLRNKKIAARQNELNSEAYYSSKSGTTDANYLFAISEDETKAYVEKQAPYHVSHILVKVDASSDGTGTWSGQISSDDAKQIGNAVRMLASTNSFGSVAQSISDDSADSYGELSGAAGVAMQRNTSYVNEFKLGLYSYDAYLNPNISAENKAKLKETLRFPESSVADDESLAEDVKETSFYKGEAFGIPLSVALTMGYVAEKEKDDNGIKVAYASTDQYPRNILFNNYFNNHAINFIYDDSADYEASFLTAIQQVYGSSYDTIDKVKADLSERYDEYNYVKGQLDNIASHSSSKFRPQEEVIAAPGKLVSYINDGVTTTVGDVVGSKNILCDENGHPIFITRSGTSGDNSYQGIHFIVVNNDPFVDPENEYKYYRVNIPNENRVATSDAYTSDYKTNPSIINFVKGDTTTTSAQETYKERAKWVTSAVKSYDSNMEFKIFEANLAIVTKATSIDDAYNKGKEIFGADELSEIRQYISYTREASSNSADDTLDSSWESYVQMINLHQTIQPRGLIPTVCVNYFNSGDYEAGGKEQLCHVTR